MPVPLTVTLVIDESGSTSKTDPTGHRHDESEQIARWMARYSGDQRDALGLVQFANTAVGYGPVSVGAAASMLATAFAQRPNIGHGTVLAPAVQKVERELHRLPAGVAW